MDETRRPKMKTISVIVDGRNCCQKVTKNTTCGEVIQHLLKHSGLKKNNKDSYFLFASNNITEQKLSKKIKVLKVAEDLASGTNRLNFILRKKIRLREHDIAAITRRRLREKSSVKELKVENVEPIPYAPLRAPKQIRGVKHLYELVKLKKRSLIESDEKLNDITQFMKQSMEKNTSFMNKSKAEINLGQFPEKLNVENMNGLLSFCDTVTTKTMCVSQRVTSTDQKRTRRNLKPVHSTPLVNKTMTYLNRSRNRTRMTRQLGTSELPLDKLTNLQPQKIQRRDSYLSRRERKPAFSKQNEGCKYLCEHSYVSELDENLENTLLDKVLDKSFDSNADVRINCSIPSASSSNVISDNIQSNDRHHFVLPFDSSSRVMSYVQDGQEDANDCLSVQTLKMKLVDYSLSDSDISSVASEIV